MLYGRIIGAVAVMVLGAALLAGCGDDGEASSGVTKAEFSKKAEAVCKERKKDWESELAAFRKESEAKGDAGLKVQKERSEALLSETLIPVLEEDLAALEDLDVPEADEEKIDEMLQSYSRGIEKLDEDGVEGLFSKPFKEFEKEAKAYGLSCPAIA